MHPSYSPDKQTNINSPEPKIACNDEWQDFYQELHVFRTHLICTDHQLQALCSVFAELGLTPLQEFMHALSEAAKMPSITSHVEIKRGVNIANQLRHQSIDAVT